MTLSSASGHCLQHLTSRAQFQAVMAGRTVSRTVHFALHSGEAQPPLFDASGPWIGAVLPKRWARRAVTRNTIKRQIYSVAQDLAPQFPAVALVVRLRSGFDRAKFPSAYSERLSQAVRSELQQLFSGAPWSSKS